MARAPVLSMIGRKLGRYQLTARMAVGGMAEVWLAQAVGISGFQKMVVVKTILPHLASDENYVQMFKQEAVLAALLNHKNIVQIYELGEVDGVYFIAMEHLLGRTLRQVQRQAHQTKTPLPPWFVVHVATAVCEALDFAHHMTGEDGKPLNIVHRDVTPDNIMVTFSGVTKVLDFGIAKASVAQRQTSAGTLKGKFAYIAPERILAAHGASSADKRSDVFSIGAVLYEMLAGDLPFAEKDDIALLRRILDGSFTPLRQRVPDVPERLEQIIHKALAADPAKRYQSAGELAEELARFVAERRRVSTTERHIAQYMAGLFKEAESVEGRGSQPPLELQGFEPSRPGPGADEFAQLVQPWEGARPKRDDAISPNAIATSAAFNEALVDSMDLDPRPSILVADGDRVSRRFVELALGKDERFRVLAVPSGKAALELMQTRLVDLVISEVDLSDMKGLDLLASLARITRLPPTPCLFLTAETKVAVRVAALSAGADGFLLKPCDALEVMARVEGLLDRHRSLRSQLLRRPYVLAGSFSALPLSELSGLLEMERRTGTLAISGPTVVGEAVFEDGRLVHAGVGDVSGDEAFFRLTEETAGQFEFSHARRVTAGDPITMSASELVMEAARVVDHRRRDGQTSEPKPAPVAPRMEAADSSLIAPPGPTSALAMQFEMGVRDGFSLGELRLSNTEELIGWMLSPTGEQRFHVHLVGDPGEGVSSMLGLAAPPTEREVLVGLNAESKLLSLDFFLRNERMLDVLLLDIRRPSEFSDCLVLRPSLYIIAPPGGDFLSVGTDARVQLESLLERLQPTVVMGVGSSALRESLPQLAYLQRPDVRTTHLSGTLGKGATDLRTVLVHGIRFWAGNAAAPGG